MNSMNDHARTCATILGAECDCGYWRELWRTDMARLARQSDRVAKLEADLAAEDKRRQSLELRINELISQLAAANERATQAEAKLREVRSILYAYEGTKAGNCITSDPYWLILRNGCLRGDDSVLTGPFFSKDEAEAHRRARIYAYGEKSYCYALSAHARQFRRLREIVKEECGE